MEEIEKPHLIYGMARSRSTAILEASNKQIKLNEPFNPNNFKLSENLFLIDDNDWIQIENKMQKPNTATKILPIQLNMVKASNQWYEKAQIEDKFEIFVVHRNLEEICWSYAMVPILGWYSRKDKKQNSTIKPTEIPQDIFDAIEEHIKSYIHFFPKRGFIITWENLPKIYFDKSRVTTQYQNSKDKINSITNLDFCREKINILVSKYDSAIKEKTKTLECI